MRYAIAVVVLAACSGDAAPSHCGDGITDPARGEQCDDGNTLPGDGCSPTCQLEVQPGARIQTNWQIVSLASDGTMTPMACPEPYDTAILHTAEASVEGFLLDDCQQVDPNCFIDVFDCARGSGATSPLPPGSWVTWVDITDHTGQQLYAQSKGELVVSAQTDQQVALRIFANGGYIAVSWALFGASSHLNLMCEQTAAATSAGGTLALSATPSPEDGSVFTVDVPCEAYAGYSAPLAQGIYDFEVSALDASGHVIGQVSIPQVSVGIQDFVSQFGQIGIPIDGL
jgi:cysteine-rich repeat protein